MFEAKARLLAGPAAKLCISCVAQAVSVTQHGTWLYSQRPNCGCFNEVFVFVNERISEANLDTQIECLNCVICY